MKPPILKFVFIVLLFIIYLLISSYSYAKSVFTNLSSSTFRLHILANSDSTEDQALKLCVRDHIIQYLKEKTKFCKTKEEVIAVVSNHLIDLQKIALQTIKENGHHENVSLEIGNFNFPTKYYGNIAMPAGNYDALRIKIGKAERSKLVV